MRNDKLTTLDCGEIQKELKRDLEHDSMVIKLSSEICELLEGRDFTKGVVIDACNKVIRYLI